MINFEISKEDMIKKQLIKKAITNERVLKAFYSTPRHLFIESQFSERSYDDTALPIGEEQSISQPYIIGLMTELLNPLEHEIILEIGTGSGFQTAIISKLAKYVFTIERLHNLVLKAKHNMKLNKIDNVKIIEADGSFGWKKNAPYDGIIVTAGASKIPNPLIDQLKNGGRMVIPVGQNGNHILKLILKEESKLIIKDIVPCSFVPLIGKF